MAPASAQNLRRAGRHLQTAARTRSQDFLSKILTSSVTKSGLLKAWQNIFRKLKIPVAPGNNFWFIA
jgi:hypothetical protein